MALYALDDGGSDESCHDGVFRVVFKVTAAQRVAVQVHARTEYDVDAIFQCLVADGAPHLLHQVGVPAGGETGADGESRGKERLVGIVSMGVDMYAGRTVSHYRGRDAQSGYGYRRASCSCHEFLLVSQHGTRTYEGIVAATNKQLGFLLERHGVQHLVDVVSLQFHLCCHRCHC